MARLFADEHFPFETVAALRRLGHDVLTLQETGRANKGVSDNHILALASADKRAVLTGNRRDFFREHKKYSDHQGIIACTKNLNYTELADSINKELRSRQDLRGQVVRVYRPNKELNAELPQPEREHAREKTPFRQRLRARARRRARQTPFRDRGDHNHER